jgi:hypothetical protein
MAAKLGLLVNKTRKNACHQLKLKFLRNTSGYSVLDHNRSGLRTEVLKITPVTEYVRNTEEIGCSV